MSQLYSPSSQEQFINNIQNNNLDFPLLIDYNNSSERNIKSLTPNIYSENPKNKININENNNIYLKNKKSHDIFEIPEKCRRCRSKYPEIMCKDCYPFIYFCANCSNNLHSMESKKNHNIIPLKGLNQEIFNEINNNNLDIFSNEDSFQNKYNTNLNEQKYITNYINDIKSLYEKEKNNLIKKSFSLEKNLENTKQIYDDKISELQEKLTKLQNNKNIEFKILEETKNYELSKILEEKQNKIDILVKRNEELNKFNEELIKKNSEYLEIINKSKLKNIDIIQRQKDEIEQLRQEKDDLIKYYEKKINSMNNVFNEEKNNLIKTYEEQIKKINFDYNNNKEKMKSILFQREKDIENLINSHKNTINEMTKEINNYKNKNQLKNQEYDDLIKTINEKNNEIEELKNNLNKQNKKYIDECKDKMRLEKKFKELNSIIEDIRGKNVYLNRLTHGKLKK